MNYGNVGTYNYSQLNLFYGKMQKIIYNLCQNLKKHPHCILIQNYNWELYLTEKKKKWGYIINIIIISCFQLCWLLRSICN